MHYDAGYSLLEVAELKHPRPGWGHEMRRRMGYFTPDDHFETTVAQLVRPGSAWCDVGCGREVLPPNQPLARALAERASRVYGIDPDSNILENALLSDRFHGQIEDCPERDAFDVMTLRMVAEHITDPERVMNSIAAMLKPGGRVVIYTPYKWSPMALAARIAPFKLHAPLKRLLWPDIQDRDTFPTAFRLNDRKDIRRHAERSGLRVESFTLLDDCSLFARFKTLHLLDLSVRRACRAIGAPYPERCILAVLLKPSATPEE